MCVSLFLYVFERQTLILSVDEKGKWGIRIESALLVKEVETKHGDGNEWFGFERLTCVPIQTKMVKASSLTAEEKRWIKAHNNLCLDKLEPYLKEDKRALKWLKSEVSRGIGVASPVAGCRVVWQS